MATFWESIKNALGNAYCTVSDFSVWYATQAAALVDSTNVDELGELQRDLFIYWNSLVCGGDTDSIVPAQFNPPFTGGQCVGASYSTQIAVDVYNSSGVFITTSTRTQSLIGQIKRIFLRTSKIVSIEHNFPNATVINDVFTLSVSSTNYYQNPRFLSITRTGGLPDNCGNPPAYSAPTNQPFVTSRDITYTDEFGASKTATAVQFTYGLPFIEPDGSVSVPYEVCYDSFCFKGKTNFGEEFLIKPEPPNKPLLPPLQTVGEPTGTGTETPDPELDGEPLPEAEKAKKPILGVFVKSQKTGSSRKATEIFLGDYAPAILAPNIGFVRYRVYVEEESGWLADIPIKNVDAYIPVPDKLEAVEVRVEWQAGWKGKYLINRGKHCCQECADSD